LMSRRVGRVNGRHCSGPRKKSPAPWLAARRRDADCNRTWKALRPGLSRLRCSQHVRLWPVGRGHVGALPHCCGPRDRSRRAVPRRKPLCGGANVNLTGRCGQSASVVSSPPLYRMCHDVRSSTF
jgi:hypothetical protein